MQSVAATEATGNRVKIAGAALLLCAAAMLVWRGWHSIQPSAAINNGSLTRNRPLSTKSGGGAPPGLPAFSKEERAAFEKARNESKGDPAAMRQAMEKLLTPEQKQRMKERRAEMDAKMKRAMSPEDYASLQHKIQTGGLPAPPGGGTGAPPPGGPPL